MRFCVWIAEGFGSGRIPVAPGTFGSVVGLFWFAVLLWTGGFWFYVAGALGAAGFSVWCCGLAEKALQREDPGSIVLDEIVAVPLCFFAPLLSEYLRSGQLISAGFFWGSQGWYVTVTGFGLFRLFDVWKPWPVGKSQELPAGWGVTTDDLLAAVYVNICLLPFVL